eukprot:5046295-Amphidinium_carterae.1
MEEWTDGSEWQQDWTYTVDGPDEEDPEYAAYPANAGAGGPWAGQHPVTTKIPPGYNATVGLLSKKPWSVEDWLDITELEDARRGPALKARLEGAAYMHRAVLNQDRLKAVNGDGVSLLSSTRSLPVLPDSKAPSWWPRPHGWSY